MLEEIPLKEMSIEENVLMQSCPDRVNDVERKGRSDKELVEGSILSM